MSGVGGRDQRTAEIKRDRDDPPRPHRSVDDQSQRGVVHLATPSRCREALMNIHVSMSACARLRQHHGVEQWLNEATDRQTDGFQLPTYKNDSLGSGMQRKIYPFINFITRGTQGKVVYL